MGSEQNGHVANKTENLCILVKFNKSLLRGVQLTLSQHSWWRHQIETFSALLGICAGNSPVPGEFPTQRPVTRSFDVFFDLRLNKRLSKQSWGWWFETLSCPLWRHCNVGSGNGSIPNILDDMSWMRVLSTYWIYAILKISCFVGKKIYKKSSLASIKAIDKRQPFDIQ